MKVSSKSRYALLALVELDLRTRGGGRPVPLAGLAAARGIPEQYLEQLFASLRRAGFVVGRRGAGGGFAFARSPDRLTVLDVVRALDGSAEPAAEGPGGDVRDGPGAAVWRTAGQAYETVLAGTTIGALADRERVSGAGTVYEI